jgi:hypothetical protein
MCRGNEGLAMKSRDPSHKFVAFGYVAINSSYQ